MALELKPELGERDEDREVPRKCLGIWITELPLFHLRFVIGSHSLQ